MATLQRFVVNIGGKSRREKLGGRWHTVVPIAMLPKRGVVPGSKGKVLYDEEDNRSAVPAWNHKPMVVNHPQDEDGNNISGALPRVLNERAIGLILNTALGEKLTTEGWFDEERTLAVDRRIMDRIQKGESIEASTGLIVDLEEEDGDCDGEHYDYRATNHRPDHLAILPDKLGAYPVSKGGGVFAVNESVQPASVRQVLRRSTEVLAVANGLATMADNELSYSDIACRLSDLLREKYGKPGHYWNGSIEAVYDNRVVFRDGDDYSAMKMIGYKTGDDAVSLYGEAKPVERVVEYRAAGESYAVNDAGELVLSEGETMAFDKKAHVAKLIEAGVVKAEDKDNLEKLPEAALQLFVVPVVKTPEVTANEEEEDDAVLKKPPVKKVVKKKETATNEETPAVVKSQKLEEFVANLDDDGRAEFARMKRAADAHDAGEKRQKAALIKEVLATNVFTEKYLKDRSLDELKGLAKLARSKKDDVLDNEDSTYVLAGGGIGEDDIVENEQEEELPSLPSPRMSWDNQN